MVCFNFLTSKTRAIVIKVLQQVYKRNLGPHISRKFMWEF